MCLNKIIELESSLQKLLSILKRNREQVPRDELRTRFRNAYYQLLGQINHLLWLYICTRLTDRLYKNPYMPEAPQIEVLQQAIDESGLIPEISRCISRTYSIAAIEPLIQRLKSKVETALWPFVDLETCLVADLDHMEREPVIYNTITKQIWVDGKWVDHELNLEWKLLIYLRERPYDTTIPVTRKETLNEYLPNERNETNCNPVDGQGNGADLRDHEVSGIR